MRYHLYVIRDITVSEARAELGPVTSRAEYGGEFTYLTTYGRRTAAIVPAAAAELLEQIEDLVDAEIVRVALEDLESWPREEVSVRPSYTRADCVSVLPH